MNSWWQSFYHWIGTDQSANLAQWAGGLGTTAAFVWVVALWRKDRSSVHRSQAEQVITLLSTSDVLVRRRLYMVKVLNASSKPIFNFHVIFRSSRVGVKATLSSDDLPDLDEYEVVEAGQWVAASFQSGANGLISVDGCFLEFQDASSGWWVKNLMTHELREGRWNQPSTRIRPRDA